MFTYISPKCRKLAVFIFLGLNLCLESKTVCVLQHYIVPKLTNTAQPTETFHTCDVSWLLLEERGTPCWWVYQGFGLLNTGLSFLCVPVCWWAEHSSVHCPPEAINRSDEMKSLCSLPKLLCETCMAVFWQPVALNHHFMMARENVSVFLPMIYVHWSLEDMIIWPRQMDWEIPKGFCAKRSHAPHKWSPHAGERAWHLCSSPQRHVPLLLPMNYTYVQLCWGAIKSHNS